MPNSTPESELRTLRQANAEARARLVQTAGKLRALFAEKSLMEETPLEVSGVLEAALHDLRAALHALESAARASAPPPPPARGPTRQQGQFLAFIDEYIRRNEQGIAPSHADLQSYFQLTPPSVNSMLIRLEQRGFIRRIPGRARAIELSIDPDLIPPLDRPFRY